MKLFLLTLLSIVLLYGGVKDINAPFNIIQPQNKTTYVGKLATFVIEVDTNNTDTIEIIQNNKTTKITVNNTKNTYCKTIKLTPGMNPIYITLYKNDEATAEIKRELYFLSELFEGSEEEAEDNDFERKYFHTDKKEKSCVRCHDMSSNVPTDGDAYEDVTKTTCFNCHNSLMKVSNSHAPSANWLCLDCHTGKFDEYNMQDNGKTKYLAPDPIAKTCFACHENVEEWFHRKYTHGPVNDGRCIRCHNPHGSQNEFFLRKHIWDLCTTCHAEKADGKHVVASFVFSRNGGAHPTKAPKDPARPEREFTCSSCHNPHGSNGVFLLRMKGSMPFNVCRRCHKK